MWATHNASWGPLHYLPREPILGVRSPFIIQEKNPRQSWWISKPVPASLPHTFLSFSLQERAKSSQEMRSLWRLHINQSKNAPPTQPSFGCCLQSVGQVVEGVIRSAEKWDVPHKRLHRFCMCVSCFVLLTHSFTQKPPSSIIKPMSWIRRKGNQFILTQLWQWFPIEGVAGN